MSDKIRVPDLIRMRKRGERIVALTAYDYVSASILDKAGVDLILVGDSLGTVVQGSETTLAVTMEEMIYHSRMVSRAASRALVVADMPFLSYQPSLEEAFHNAGRLVKEAGAAAVKLEGGVEVAEIVSSLVRFGIPVMGHVGLKPQLVNELGGYRVQGKKEDEAESILLDAKALEEAGAFAVVLEAIPAELAEKITACLSIPTIGIGAGVGCSGQILVLHDMIGLVERPSQSDPKFVRRYANVAEQMRDAVIRYGADVRSREFPSSQEAYHLHGAGAVPGGSGTNGF